MGGTAPDFDDAEDLVRGRGGPDLQEDILDSQQTMGLEGEIAAHNEERQIEQLDVLEGLRQLQTADPITWKVYRSGHEEAKYNGYLGQLQTTSLTQEYIRKKFGGGTYRVRGTFSGGKYAAQRQFTVAGESILYIPTEINGASPVSTPASAFNMSEFLTVQQTIEDKRREADERRRRDDDERAERRAAEMRNFIVSIGGVVAPIVTALVTRTSAPPAAGPDVAALITALKPITSSESPMTQMKGMLEMMTMMRELIPDGGGGSDTTEMVKAVASIAGPALQAFTQNRQPTVQPRPRVGRPDPTRQPSQPAKPAPVTIDATPVATPAPRVPVPGEQPTRMQASSPSMQSGVDLSAPTQPMTQQENNMFAQMKPQVDALVQMARDGADAKAVGELFFDQYLTQAPDEMYDQLCDLFEDERTIGRMALFNKGVTEFRPWFVDLQAAVVKKIKEESAQALAPDPSSSEAIAAGAVDNTTT